VTAPPTQKVPQLSAFDLWIILIAMASAERPDELPPSKVSEARAVLLQNTWIYFWNGRNGNVETHTNTRSLKTEILGRIFLHAAGKVIKHNVKAGKTRFKICLFS
jgi:hypothetical protein